ncbi:hypothetical protein Cgig2_024892 [Carnegiea gigantea]|uniref:Uncharacterized protein n=1 Tax=Carnegiea gigantea TaxID=171969 RepID=A0A9Q1QG40_9CARY|nr:hypothetical protein Cgig2_024892 [Carnegiea gigantea]
MTSFSCTARLVGGMSRAGMTGSRSIAYLGSQPQRKTRLPVTLNIICGRTIASSDPILHVSDNGRREGARTQTEQSKRERCPLLLKVGRPQSKRWQPRMKSTVKKKGTSTSRCSLAEPLKVTKEQVALAEKQILDLQAKYQKLEKSTAKYKHRLENEKKEKEALELVDFIPPATDEGDLGNEETTPPDGGAASSDGKGQEDEVRRMGVPPRVSSQ